MSDPIKTTRNGAILEIVLDRPKANAIDIPTSRRMGEVFARFRDDESLRVAILTGGGAKFFSAGWDLNEAAEAGGSGFSADFGQGGLYGFPELPGLEKPVICAVNGYAIGSGFELMLGADLVVASDKAQMWLPETQLGLAPDVATFRLPKILPPVIANEILYAGRRLGAAEAAGLGLINRVVAPEALMDTAREMAAQVVRSAPLAVAATKQTIRLAADKTIAQCYAAIRNGDFPLFARMMASSDAAEGPKAALEGRDPVWKGQ